VGIPAHDEYNKNLKPVNNYSWAIMPTLHDKTKLTFINKGIFYAT